MFPLSTAQLEARHARQSMMPPRPRQVSIRATRHLLVTHQEKSALIDCKSEVYVPMWISYYADQVEFLTPEQAAVCSALLGEFVYDELYEEGELSMVVVCGIKASNGFELRRPMTHIDSSMLGLELVWKLGFPLDS